MADRRMRSTATLATLLLALAGCRGRALAPNANDALREELARRTDERDAAVARASELESKLAASEKARAGSSDPEVEAARPALARLSISGLSAIRPSGPDTAACALVLVPSDGLGRFTQVAGTLKVSVAAMVPGSAPLPAGTLVLKPLELRERYRSGFLGTHYTIEMPLAWDAGALSSAPTAFAVAVEFSDGPSGRTFPASATIPMSPIEAKR